MRKIKGFKLDLRIKEIQRRAKKAKIDLAALNLGADDALTALISRFSASARPSVIYDTFPPEGAKAPASEGAAAAAALSPLPGLAYSVAIATMGPDIDQFIDERVQTLSEFKPILDVMARAALDDAARFVLGLIEEEAREEQCELSPIQYATDAAVLKTIVNRMAGHKIGVAAADQGLRPIHTCAFSLSWVARSKSRAK